jgi:hypothetical protein
LLTFFLSTIFIFGQATTGRIIGTVSDPSGAVIPGAKITVTDNQTGKTIDAVATDDGTFTVSQLEFGTYTVKIIAQGYKTFTAPDVKIDAGHLSVRIAERTKKIIDRFIFGKDDINPAVFFPNLRMTLSMPNIT